MQLEQTLEMYRPIQMQETQKRQRVYTIGDLESLSASALYSGDSGSSGGGFVPASNFGLGPGIAKETDFGFIERYRAPEIDDAHGEHINLESYLPGSTKSFLNIHIDLNGE